MNFENQNWEDLILKLKTSAKEKGITNVEISERTGIKVQNVSRFFSLKFAPSIKITTHIANAIGVKLYVE